MVGGTGYMHNLGSGTTPGNNPSSGRSDMVDNIHSAVIGQVAQDCFLIISRRTHCEPCVDEDQSQKGQWD